MLLISYLQYNTQDSEGQMAGAFGDDIREVPPQVLDDISQPHYLGTVPSNEEDADHHDEKSSTVTSTRMETCGISAFLIKISVVSGVHFLSLQKPS